MNVSRQIGWSNESNLLYQILKQLTRLTAVIFGLKPKYKVFTALLTQNGGDGPLTTLSGALTVGVTYKLGTIQGNDDFTNVGAPTNEFGISFVATGTTPANWESQTELEYNTGAPTAIVLENTIGNIWFTYLTFGIYSVNSNNLFIENKTAIDIDAFGENAVYFAVGSFIVNETIFTESMFNIYTARGGGSRDEVLQKNRLEIRVYN
jgi:hypothetical protein